MTEGENRKKPEIPDVEKTVRPRNVVRTKDALKPPHDPHEAPNGIPTTCTAT
jgi:hypothetical protein